MQVKYWFFHTPNWVGNKSCKFTACNLLFLKKIISDKATFQPAKWTLQRELPAPREQTGTKSITAGAIFLELKLKSLTVS